MKLLKGKDTRSDLVCSDYLPLVGCALAVYRASISWCGRKKGLECGLLASVIAFPTTAYVDWGLRLWLGCWHNDLVSPVLKHGPRSLTSMRVFGCKTHMRNESERRWEPLTGCTIDRSWCLRMDLSKSIAVGTRKMVNYAWIGWSQRKLWWRLAAVLTCKSIVKFGHGGERLIEPSSSWLPPKFPSG